eukprot:COSAG04_NODE_2154_length_4676_cov_9.156859_4_plen_293_part_00
MHDSRRDDDEGAAQVAGGVGWRHPAAMALGVATPARRGAMLWIVAWHCHLPLLAAQMTTSGVEDAGVLREAKAAADTSACTGWDSRMYPDGSAPCPLDSWTADTEPCGDGYNSWDRGWLGVECDARGGRVVAVYLGVTGVGGELLPFFGRLGALHHLWLEALGEHRGDVADLAGAAELRYLNVNRSPLVVGEAAALAALVHLGEEYTLPSGPGTGHLCLGGSGVHGPVAALRALHGLGADWGGGHEDFTPCSAFGGSSYIGVGSTWATGSPGCGAAGLVPVAVSPTPRWFAR